MSSFVHHTMFPMGEDPTPYRKLTSDYVSEAKFEGQKILKIDPRAITELTFEAFKDVSHLLRPAHLTQLTKILDDPEASDNDRFVALDLLKNANIASGGVLPMCQDTGTAIVMGKKVKTFGPVAAMKPLFQKALKRLILKPICGIHKLHRLICFQKKIPETTYQLK